MTEGVTASPQGAYASERLTETAALSCFVKFLIIGAFLRELSCCPTNVGNRTEGVKEAVPFGKQKQHVGNRTEGVKEAVPFGKQKQRFSPLKSVKNGENVSNLGQFYPQIV